MLSLVTLLLLVLGVLPNKVRRLATAKDFDAFTKYPPVPPLPAEVPKNSSDSGGKGVHNSDSVTKHEEIRKFTTKSTKRDPTEHKTTEPYVVNDDFPEKEPTPTQTDWFDPFTNTPWGKNAKKYTTDNNDVEDYDIEDNSNSEAINSSSSVYHISRTYSLVTIIIAVWRLRL